MELYRSSIFKEFYVLRSTLLLLGIKDTYNLLTLILKDIRNFYALSSVLSLLGIKDTYNLLTLVLKDHLIITLMPV